MSRSIYIMLSMTGTKFSRFLRLCTNKEYTHVSLSLDKEMTQLYSFGRRSNYMPIIAGFVKENPQGGVFSKYDTLCSVYEIEVSDEEYDRIRGLIASFLAEYKQYQYNFLGLPLIALQIPRRCRRHFVCSQFVAYLITLGGVATFPKDYSIVQPEDFYTLKGLRPVYKGTLKEYIQQVRTIPAAV
ncbi:MAG: hypothetical protein VB100_03640 [Angelakisella sp.]|nr:hypothetical protein [Angelakisella sp.]